jgi:hypothetical protein
VTQYVVVLREQGTVYGPFENDGQAEHFADYLTDEVDPADVRALCSPVADLLGWRTNVAVPLISRLPACATPADCPLGPEPHQFAAPPEQVTGLCCSRQPWEARA